MTPRALLVVEARGQAIHLREDACLNLTQAGYLASRLAARGVEPHVRLVIDAGQSVEEYSVLYHRPEEELEEIDPRTIAEAIGRRVLGQEVAVREMAVALAKHLAGLATGNILMIPKMSPNPALCSTSWPIVTLRATAGFG